MTTVDPRDFDSFYDVVIVGGRPAGASLAARLGGQGARVLVVDRAEDLGTAPSVPSCPILYPSGMSLLDELGVDEKLYGNEGTRLGGLILQFGDWFSTSMSLLPAHGRDYVHNIDRAVLDGVLWKHLARYPSVEARSGFSVTELSRGGDGAVTGVVGHARQGSPERIGARCVVGADGRYSPVARMAGARGREEQTRHMSAVYFTDWEDLSGLEALTSASVQVFASGKGRNVLVFPFSKTKATVCAYIRADHLPRSFEPETYYREFLDGFPKVRQALKGARPLGRVVGMRRIENGYRQAGGPGWALVGDALHYKDPVDGQGIYDALLESRLLAELLPSYLSGARPWGELVATYERQVIEATRPMYLATMQRIKQELYTSPPPLVARTVLRWLLNDPEYQRRFVLFLSRAIPPAEFPPPMGGVILRGLGRDLRALVS